MGQRRLGLDRIQVAATLRRMREEAGLSRDEAAAALDCTAAKISNLELGRTGVKTLELEKLLDLYDASGDEREALIETARAARGRRPRTPHGSLLPLRFRRAYDLETQARAVMFYSPEVIPGVLQTENYLSALLSYNGVLGHAEIERRLSLWQRRRKVLTAGSPPVYHCILGEAALYKNVGGPAVMWEQLTSLVECMREAPTAAVQILPLASGPHGFMGMTTTILRFDPPAPDVLHNDIPERDPLTDKPSEVKAALRYFGMLQDHALDQDESLSRIMEVAEEHRKQADDA
ncbi:helix-turn-helix domain-containing protein [Longimycelium tulufanense]|nr:helix-turn-helix transcriptional regulator [Longimycelium tulufanense]